MAEKEYIEWEKIKSYISQLRDHTSANVGLSDAEYSFISDVMVALDNFTAADVAPVKHGHWTDNKHTDTAICSECKAVFTDETNFCPKCGAKMDE